MTTTRQEPTIVKIGDQFDQLTVIQAFIKGHGKKAKRWVKCRCSCDREKDFHAAGLAYRWRRILAGDLRRGRQITCGHGAAEATRLRNEANGVKIGDKFGRWKVISTWVEGEKRREHRMAACICECGTFRVGVDCHNMRALASQSCNCLHKEVVRKRWQLLGVQPGDTHGELKVLDIYFTSGERSHRIAICKCSCGVFKHIVANSLVQGMTKSCGHFGLMRLRSAHKAWVEQNRLRRGYKAHLPIAGLNQSLQDLFRPVSLSIKLRDNFTCQLCGKVGGYLHTHHRVPKRQSLDHYMDPLNLVCLCRGCHLGVHDQSTRNPPNARMSKILAQCAIWAELDSPSTYDVERYMSQVHSLVAKFKQP